MDSEKLKRLRKFYHSLLEQQRWFDKLSGGTFADEVALLPLVGDFSQLNSKFPDLISPF